MSDKLNELKNRMAEISDLDFAAAVLGWDRETYMPPGASETRGQVLATLGRLSHEKFTSDEVGKLFDELSGEAKDWDDDSDEARMIKIGKRDYERRTKVPSAMIEERTKISNAANDAWRKARQDDNFSLFEPHLEKVMDFNRRYAELFKPWDHVYDALLEDYEPGMKTVDVQTIFDGIRPTQVALLEAIADQPQVDDSVLHKHYPTAGQIQSGDEVTRMFGFNYDNGRQDAVHHPFMTNLGYGDIRITYRVDEQFLPTYLMAIFHEAGHGLYEMGIPKEKFRTSLYGGTSLAIHESQSRLWENLVGRSRPFWEFYLPKLKKIFPEQVGSISVEDFYNAVNKVEPSMIRVEADEATYNMHIMLRMEIEIGLMEGSMAVKDLPEIWNSRMQSYLGITPANNAEGVLQDVHWSFGGVGYFPTYALGNLVSAQLWEKMAEDMPNRDEQIAKGDFSNILGWLTEKVYQHGRKYDPQELVENITGERINGDAYIRYLQNKFGEIYGL